MTPLIVYLNAERVGRLDQDDTDQLRFVYDRSWIDTPSAIPLSRSLPLSQENKVYTGKIVRSFFAGILPEEEPRQIIAKILGISDANDFAMLTEIGGECAGAVSLLPEDILPTDLEHIPGREMTETELRQIVMELPHRPLMVGTDGLRLSLAGAQDKLPIILHDNRISLPIGNTPSTHILKPEPDRFSGLAMNEWFCMTLAQSMGLNVPHTEYRLIGGKPCLLVQRYDRETDQNGHTTRIHQEDFCQAMGYPPEQKYQAENGPTLRDCISLLQEWSTAPVIDVPAFINGLIFNVLIGNADAHGKNFSLLYSLGEQRLSPFYDLVSTLAWPTLTKRLAMKIGNCDSIHAFTLYDWQKMAEKGNLSWPLVRERMKDACQLMLDKLNAVQIQTQNHNREMSEHLHGMISERALKMLKGLSAEEH